MQKAIANKFTFVLHGGAGGLHSGILKKEMIDRYNLKLIEILKEVYSILSKGGSSIDAVEEAIILMEKTTLFNSGKGSITNTNGEVEMEASIMDGTTQKAGAVAGVRNIKHPITLARRVYERTPQVLLIGKPADTFGESLGMEVVTKEYFTEEPRYWKVLQEESHNGTVGAVAVDSKGNIAAGTSTGGTSHKLPGRIGDSSIIGAGTFADSNCGISCTGVGEFYIRGVVAHNIVTMKEYKGISLEEAVKQTLKSKVVDLGGEGGVIAVDKEGNIAIEYNTPGMIRAYIKEDGIPYVIF